MYLKETRKTRHHGEYSAERKRSVLIIWTPVLYLSTKRRGPLCARWLHLVFYDICECFISYCEKYGMGATVQLTV